MKFSTISLLSLVGAASAFAPATNAPRTFALEMARKPFISGNWKLNPQTKDEAMALASGIADAVTSDSPDADVALFVPYVYIDAVKGSVGDKLHVGAEVSRLFPTSFFRNARNNCWTQLTLVCEFFIVCHEIVGYFPSRRRSLHRRYLCLYA